MPYVNPNRSFSSSSSSDAFAPVVYPLLPRRVSYRLVLANSIVGPRTLPQPAPDTEPVTPQRSFFKPEVVDDDDEPRGRGLLPYAIRTRIKTLKRVAGQTLHRIAAALGEPYSTVQTIAAEAATPARRGLYGLRQFGTPIANRIVDYVTSGVEGRRATYQQIKERLQLLCSVNTIRRRLNKRRYQKRVARRAPFLDADSLDLRPQFGQWCLDYLDNNRTFLFGDRAAFGKGGSSKVLVIRRANKAFDPDCLGPRYRRIKSQFVFALISGTKKLRIVFWELVQGNITAAGIAEHVLPELHRFWREIVDSEAEESAAGFRNDWFVDEGRFSYLPPRQTTPGTPIPVDDLVEEAQVPAAPLPMLCLNSAAVYKAAAFRGQLDILGIPYALNVWPANSPDLNPIKNLQALLKWRLNYNYPLPSSTVVLRQQIQEVWDAVTAAEISRMTGSFRTRCEKVIARKGRYTGY